MLRLQERKGRQEKVTEIPIDEVEDLILPTKRTLLNDLRYPGRQEHVVLGDTGIPRLPNGRPAPKALRFLMRNVPHPGITLRSDKHLLSIGQGLPEAELVYLHAFILKAIAG
jgi:hypothetical protein